MSGQLWTSFKLILAFGLLFFAAQCKHADSARQIGSDPVAAGETVVLAAEPSSVVLGAAPTVSKLPKSVDPKDLDERERQILADLLGEQFDPCGKTRSFMDALRADDCPMAVKLAARLVDWLGPQGMSKQQAVQALLREIERLNTVVTIDTRGAPMRGPADAKVTIVEFSDFECPYCRRVTAPLEKLRAHYNVLLFYKFYPLKHSHPNAVGAARAAWAAHQQGKFWEMHDVLFANQSALDWPSVQNYAKKMGLDAKKFAADVQSEAAQAAVDADEKAGELALVDGTPTFYVNGRKGESLAQVQDMVREALAGLGLPLPQALAGADISDGATSGSQAGAADGSAPASPAKPLQAPVK